MMFSLRRTPAGVPAPEDCLPGRETPLPTSSIHYVNGNPIKPPFPDNMETVILGMGCFWGAERLFWQLDGVYTTAAGYSGGTTPNPTYEETCTSRTGHTEAVLVVYDPERVSFDDLMKVCSGRTTTRRSTWGRGMTSAASTARRSTRPQKSSSPPQKPAEPRIRRN